ncbi:MAG: DNA-binding response regulator [Gammaproteobacteria bacterium]|nr:MAG: DNA-binding response regulator [Gammaproteobacteria bacterium]
MRILVIEDETRLRQQLVELLIKNGFATDQAEEGITGEYLAMEHNYDIAVIDLGLPGKDGVSIIKTLRDNHRNYPILILTARGDWHDKVAGLEAGADDYLVKPFHVEELLARLRALLRRYAGQAKNTLDYPTFTINLTEKTVTTNNTQLDLTAFEYNTLEYLALNPGKVVSKTELTEHLYDQDFDRDSNVIEVFIGRLRKKLDPDGKLAPIKTIRGQGYQFMLSARNSHGKSR